MIQQKKRQYTQQYDKTTSFCERVRVETRKGEQTIFLMFMLNTFSLQKIEQSNVGNVVRVALVRIRLERAKEN